jgi:adenylate cyclase
LPPTWSATAASWGTAKRQIVFRIVTNLGDINLQDADIHGDGVNVSVRLDDLTELGGICLSRAVC